MSHETQNDSESARRSDQVLSQAALSELVVDLPNLIGEDELAILRRQRSIEKDVLQPHQEVVEAFNNWHYRGVDPSGRLLGRHRGAKTSELPKLGGKPTRWFVWSADHHLEQDVSCVIFDNSDEPNYWLLKAKFNKEQGLIHELLGMKLVPSLFY